MLRIKHIPTNLYFQPYKYKGSHLSKNGKIYFKESDVQHFFKYDKKIIRCWSRSTIYKKTKELIKWYIPNYKNLDESIDYYGDYYADVDVKEFIIEKI